MKSGIHPKINQITASCACGAKFTLGTTLTDNLSLDVCSQCHPFYTGKKHLIDTAGRVDKYRERLAKTAVLQAAAAKRVKKPRPQKKDAGDGR